MSALALVIGGPTASGKSALALAVAGEFGGEIINADASQLYRELPLLTAQPDCAARALAPHRLYGVLGAGEIASAQRWRDLAVDAIAAAHQVGRLPIVVGGSGLYLRALLQGLSPIPPIAPAARSKARAMWRDMGSVAFRTELERHDRPTVARLQPADGQRHMRAMEVWLATGRALSSWHAEPPLGPPRGVQLKTMLLMPPRETLWQAIDMRFRSMLASGALAEVEAAMAMGADLDLPAFKALGFRQLIQHLNREIELDQAVTRAIYETRHYAKRQITWFNHQILTDFSIKETFSAKILPEIFAFIRQYRLTPLK